MRIDRIGQNAVYFNIPGTIPAQLRDTPLILDMRLLVGTTVTLFLTGLDSRADEKWRCIMAPLLYQGLWGFLFGFRL